MLDLRSKTLLKYLADECLEGSYHVVEIKDLINVMPKKYKADATVVALCMQHLETGNYISIKYKDAKMYCLTLLPFAREVLENESNEKQKAKKYLKMGSMLYVLVFVFAFLGAFMAIMVYGMLF